MKRTDFYNTFKGTDTQALKVGGSVKVPAKINGKAEIIEACLAGASVDWDYTLAQLQEAVFAHRGVKADWSNSGSFAARDLVTVTDIKQAMLDVYFNRQDSDFWKGTMLMLVAMKSGELLLRKVDYVEGFFKEKAVDKTDEKKTDKTDKTDEKETDENEKTEETKINGLLEDLKALLNRKGSAYTADEVNLLKDAIYRVQMAVLDAIIPA